MPRWNQTTEERFLSKIDKKPDGCWIWLGAPCDDRREPYGVFRSNGKKGYAHRFSYEHHIGPIPIGAELDHTCRVPMCVNPQHLDPVTHLENSLRSPLVGRHPRKSMTQCRRGHPVSPETSYEYKSRMMCKVCRKMRDFLNRGKRNEKRRLKKRQVVNQLRGE